VGVNQRLFPRFAVEATVELIVRSGQVVAGTARNVSGGGICLETAGPVPPGVDVDVRITLVFDVERTSEPLRLPARVVWCTPLEEGHQVGTQFRPLTAEQSTYLEMFLRYLDESSRTAVESPQDDDPDKDLFSS
jgi:hypothetical protein